jgi:hypothetical protein
VTLSEKLIIGGMVGLAADAMGWWLLLVYTVRRRRR